MSEIELDVYTKLQRHLDNLPIGFPSTNSGVEIRLLKRIFSPKEAKIASELRFLPETLDQVYERIKNSGITIEELEQILDLMAKKGSINSFPD